MALIVAALIVSTRIPTTAAGAAVVRAAGGSLVSGAPGPAGSLPIEVIDVQGLGAATVLVGYDPDSLTAVACQRNVLFDVGLCNTNYDRNSDGRPDAVLFNVVSLRGVSAGGTPVALVNITWQTVAPVNPARSIVLTVQVQTFTDTEGKPLAHTAQDGQITLLPPPPTPTATATSTATLTPTATPTATPTPTATATLTPTATPTFTETPSVRRSYLPLLLLAYAVPTSPTATPTATSTPDPGQPPTFTCSNWCTPGGQAGWWRQSVTSDRPVSDWRGSVNFVVYPDLLSETGMSAVIEAPANASVRVEALYGGTWLQACKSVVFCVP